MAAATLQWLQLLLRWDKLLTGVEKHNHLI